MFVVMWKCLQCGCKGRYSTIGDHLRAVIEHNHQPESELEDATPVQQIYENEMSAMTPADVANVPSFSSRHRRNVLPLNPQTRQDVKLEGIWTESTDGRCLMCVDNGEEEHTLVFATDEMLDKMQEAEVTFHGQTFLRLSEFVVSALFYPQRCQ